MAQSDNMVLSESARQQRTAPIAVIDIGSNSIRLVIYASGGRYPFPLFNERSNCRLGEGLGADGLLQPERISVALAALSRFSGIMKSMNVSTIHAVATAAVRRAKNAIEFTGPAEAILGQPINVLSQLEEAHYVARGLTLNIPDATGLVADLGGGSLEVVALENGDVRHS
ncbi:MAG: exopolyphosphatase, partial [Pseudomonadota bacterium]|nr:exopolyphosphatase [Pseudomonadota bacterium]